MHNASQQTSLDMSLARAKTTVNVSLVRNFLHHNLHEWQKRQRVVKIVSLDPVFDKSQREFMTRQERYKRGLAMSRRISELKEIHSWSPQEVAFALSLLDEAVALSIHAIAFEPVILSQGSQSMVAKYSPLIAKGGILGCYLQTELGHGTNVSQLETVASYIPDSKEFDIHSPTLTSRKWWIGGLGKTVTHGVVQAKLILPSGENVGLHLFLVPLRSTESHKVFPGIDIGDIGPKTMGGFASMDHGYAQFNHVRIPKENMLSRFAQVSDEGKYSHPPHAKISYGGMLYIRTKMVIAGGWCIAKAATISFRYATVRRQGEQNPDGLETQIISYPSVHQRLLPIMSRAYVFIMLGRNLNKAFEALTDRLTWGDTSWLSDMHAITSGLKVLVTTAGVQDLETARRSMGGHGYSAFAGIGRLYADYLASVTYEGDNFVLDQQVVRAALKSYNAFFAASKSSMSGHPPSPRYLLLLADSYAQPPILSDSSWDDPALSILLLEWRAARMVQDLVLNRSNQEAGVNQRVSKAVTEAYVAHQVGQIVSKMLLPTEEKQVVGDLFNLYLLTTVETGLADLYALGIFNTPGSAANPARSLRCSISSLCLKLLPNAIGLSDAFGFTDWELDSGLGVYDGNVYEALWERAQMEPLNQREIPDGYEEFIKPMLEQGRKSAAKAAKL